MTGQSVRREQAQKRERERAQEREREREPIIYGPWKVCPTGMILRKKPGFIIWTEWTFSPTGSIRRGINQHNSLLFFVCVFLISAFDHNPRLHSAPDMFPHYRFDNMPFK